MLVRRGIAIVALSLVWGASTPAMAHDATPVVQTEPDVVLVLSEHADHVTTIDGGASGASVGDAIIWGPDPLYDETNTTDTGATTQGICTVFTDAGDCLLQETIVFPDSSTLELQGIQPGQAVPSSRTIVGGSGIYLGAHGTVTVAPTADLMLWQKTIEIWLPE